MHSVVDPPPLLAQLHDAADVLGRGHDAGLHVGLVDPGDVGWIGQVARVLQQQLLAVGLVHVVLHRRHRGDQVEVELALQPLLHDLHVQQSQKAAAKAKAERGGRLRLVMEAGIVEPQLFQRVAQPFVLFRVGGIDAGKDHRLDVAVARQELSRPVGRIQNRVAHPGVAHVAQAGDEIPHFARRELIGRDAAPAGGIPPRQRGVLRPGVAPKTISVPSRTTPSTTRMLGTAPR